MRQSQMTAMTLESKSKAKCHLSERNLQTVKLSIMRKLLRTVVTVILN